MRGMTKYQLEVLRLVAAGSSDGLIDFDQLLPALSWAPSKDSMQFTIRAMCAKGLIEKRPRELRRGRMRAVYALGPEGALALDPRAAASPVEPKEVRPRPARSEKEKLPEPVMELPTQEAAMEIPVPGFDMDDLAGLLEETQQSALIEEVREVIE